MSGFSARPPLLLVAQSAVAITAPADTVKNALATVTIPPLGPNDCIVVEADWALATSANNKTPAIEFGGVNVAGGNALTAVNHITMKNRIANRGATNSQVFSSPGLASYYGSSSAALGTAAVDTSVPSSLIFYMTKATGAEVCKLESYQVLVVRA